MAIVPNGQHLKQAPHGPISGQALAAIYARVSTADQADKGFSLPTQIDACRHLAQQHGYTVPETHIFQDDYPGASLNRPQFRIIRDMAQQSLVRAVIVHDLDRLSRKLAHQLLISEEFEQAGVALHVVTMPDGAKTPETQLLANVRGIIAEYERAKILERTARGRTGRGRAGHVPPGPATMGYIYVKHPDKGAHYEIHPEEAALVRRIFGLCVEERRSLESIAALLTAEGVPPPGARPGRTSRALTPIWHRSTISVILRNTAYIGPCMMGNASGYPGNATRITRRGCVSSPENSGRLLPSRPSLHPNSLKRPSSSSRPIKSRASGIGRRNTYSSPDGSAVDSVAAP